MSREFRPGLDQIRGGLLNRRVALMSPNGTADATGFVPINAMTLVRNVWAAIEPTAGSEKRESDREMSERWVIVRCYYLAAKDAVEGWWIQHTSEGVTENYDIRAIEPVNSSRKMIQFTCRMVR